MAWITTKEERAAIIGGLFALVVGVLAFVGGFIGGKSDVVALSEQHAHELERQRVLLEQQSEQRQQELLLELWRTRAALVHQSRNGLSVLENFSLLDLPKVVEQLKNVWAVERQFDVVGFQRFVRDHGSEATRQRFSRLMNERSRALYELQVFLKNAPSDPQSLPPSAIDAKTSKLVQLMQAESRASAGYFGTIQYASLKYLKIEEKVNK